MGKYIVTYRDFGQEPETSTVTFPIADITDSNFVAVSAQLDTLRQAMDEIVLGGLTKRVLVANENDTQTAVGGAFAQREIKWIVNYREVGSTTPHYLEIPCANLVYLDPNGQDKADMTDVKVAAFVDAFEAVVKYNGNAVEVERIMFVGRRT